MSHTAPNTQSAAVTARNISRLLRASGLPVSKVMTANHWTEGLTVRRVGCSNTVSIDYHSRGNLRQYQEKAKPLFEKVRELLTEKGYTLHPQLLWIECNEP